MAVAFVDVRRKVAVAPFGLLLGLHNDVSTPDMGCVILENGRMPFLASCNKGERVQQIICCVCEGHALTSHLCFRVYRPQDRHY